MTTNISNSENETFLLPIDISKYNGTKFEPDEIEIRVTNDFIEVAGHQEWRMCSGGAEKISFQRRHVLPKNIDLNSVLCRLMDDSVTILITAPSLSIVSKLSLNNNNQPVVDYVLGLDRKGLQYLKRYNTRNSNSNLRQIVKTLNNRENPSVFSKNQADNRWFLDLVNNASKTNNSGSKLFSSEQGQKNVDFVNNLINNRSNLRNGLSNTTNTHKIHLDVKQLLKSKKDEDELNKKKASKSAEIKKKKSRSKKKKSKTDENKKDESMISSQEDKKKDEKTVSIKKDNDGKSEKNESSKVNKNKTPHQSTDKEQEQQNIKENDTMKIDIKSPYDICRNSLAVIEKDISIVKTDLSDSLNFENKFETLNHEINEIKDIPTSTSDLTSHLKSLFSNFLGSSTNLPSNESSSNDVVKLHGVLKKDKSTDDKKEKHVVIAE